jgi:hypothetical protein
LVVIHMIHFLSLLRLLLALKQTQQVTGSHACLAGGPV